MYHDRSYKMSESLSTLRIAVPLPCYANKGFVQGMAGRFWILYADYLSLAAIEKVLNLTEL